MEGTVAAPPGTNFTEWVRPHLVAMANLAARLAPACDREDVVQDALTDAWRKRATYDESRGTPATWLLAIVGDKARKARRVRHHERWEDRADRPARLDDDIDLELAIRRLPRRQQMAVALVYFVGLPLKDAAQVMGCSEGTVKSTLSDARARLRQSLEVRG